ncbi:MAG: flippase-like domain-containing protein [Thermoanaerobaculia bacterium]|nr:flippase-like domain-containing protein [Thermoanaerobaculia bacterium]
MRFHPAIKTVLKAAVSIAIIVIVLRSIDPELLLRVMRQSHAGWLLWASLWFIISKLIGAFRFNDLLKTAGINLNTRPQLRLYWLGMYYNLLLPGGISGDAYKIKILMDHFNRPFRRLFSITLFDRLSGVLALGQICLVLAFGLPPLKPFGWIWALALLASITVSKILFDRMIGAGNGVWLRSSVQSLGVQLAQLVSTLGIVLALQESSDWLGYSVVFLVSSVVAMLPFTIGGAGARELTFLWGAQLLSLNPERSVAIAFLFYLISTAVALFGILYSFKSNILNTPGGYDLPGEKAPKP